MSCTTFQETDNSLSYSCYCGPIFTSFAAQSWEGQPQNQMCVKGLEMRL